MNCPPEIPTDLWDVLTVGVAGKALLLPPSMENVDWAGQLVKDALQDGTPAARLLELRCRDEGGKFSKGMRSTMEKSIATARKLSGLKDPNKRSPRAVRQSAVASLTDAGAAIAAVMDTASELMKADE